jgi:hypothetical protein
VPITRSWLKDSVSYCWVFAPEYRMTDRELLKPAARLRSYSHNGGKLFRYAESTQRGEADGDCSHTHDDTKALLEPLLARVGR